MAPAFGEERTAEYQVDGRSPGMLAIFENHILFLLDNVWKGTVGDFFFFFKYKVPCPL